MAKAMRLHLLHCLLILPLAVMSVSAQALDASFEKCLLVITKIDSDGQSLAAQKPLKKVKSADGATVYRAKLENKNLFLVHNSGQPIDPEKLRNLADVLPSETAQSSSVFILKDSNSGVAVSSMTNEFIEARDELSFYQFLTPNASALNTLFFAQDQLKIDFSGNDFDSKKRREFIETVVGGELDPHARNIITTEVKCPGINFPEPI